MSLQTDDHININLAKEIKCIHLPEIYKKLYLGNYAYAYKSLSLNTRYKFDVIINLSGQALPNNNNYQKNIKIYNCKVVDSVKTKISKTTIEIICEIIKNAEKSNLSILINCLAGINRSSFFAISYALFKYQNSESEVWIQYIKQCKIDSGYINWLTLINQSFVKQLMQT